MIDLGGRKDSPKRKKRAKLGIEIRGFAPKFDKRILS